MMNICIHTHLYTCIYTCQGGQSQGRYKVDPGWRSAVVLPQKLFPFPLQVWLDLLPKVTSWVASLDPPFHLLRLLFGLLCDIGAKYFILSFYFVRGPNVIEVDS